MTDNNSNATTDLSTIEALLPDPTPEEIVKELDLSAAETAQSAEDIRELYALYEEYDTELLIYLTTTLAMEVPDPDEMRLTLQYFRELSEFPAPDEIDSLDLE